MMESSGENNVCQLFEEFADEDIVQSFFVKTQELLSKYQLSHQLNQSLTDFFINNPFTNGRSDFFQQKNKLIKVLERIYSQIYLSHNFEQYLELMNKINYFYGDFQTVEAQERFLKKQYCLGKTGYIRGLYMINRRAIISDESLVTFLVERYSSYGKEILKLSNMYTDLF